jgi:hypothetical protein
MNEFKFCVIDEFVISLMLIKELFNFFTLSHLLHSAQFNSNDTVQDKNNFYCPRHIKLFRSCMKSTT